MGYVNYGLSVIPEDELEDGGVLVPKGDKADHAWETLVEVDFAFEQVDDFFVGFREHEMWKYFLLSIFEVR